MEISKILGIIISALFIQNFILTRFLGLCSFIALSKDLRASLSMSGAVVFVITCASVITYGLEKYILIPFNIEFLRTIAFILVIAFFVQLTEMIILRLNANIYRLLGAYLALITTNCAVLGVAILNSDMFFKNSQAVKGSFGYSVIQGFFVGIGYSLAILLMAGIRGRLELADTPKSMDGAGIAFVIAALMSMAFMGFIGFSP